MRLKTQFGYKATLLAVMLAATPLTVAAQSGEAEAPAAEAPEADDTLSTGTPLAPDGEAVGSAYLAEEHGDWQLRCIRAAEGEDPCQLYQLLTDQSGASVAEITVFVLPEGQPAVAGATVIVPLETLLIRQLTLSIDGGAARQYPFTFCTQQGCFSRIGLTEDDLAAFRRGNAAQIQIVPAAAPNQKVNVTASLSGFTAAYNGLAARRAQ